MLLQTGSRRCEVAHVAGIQADGIGDWLHREICKIARVDVAGDGFSILASPPTVAREGRLRSPGGMLRARRCSRAWISSKSTFRRMAFPLPKSSTHCRKSLSPHPLTDLR
jgi:hypothetical protein